MPTDITESDIPELPDDELDRLVAEWLGDKTIKHLTDIDDESEVCGEMRGQFCCECWPDYCNDDGAAWRLLERMPVPVDFHESTIYAEFEVGYEPTPFFRSKRGLAEVAATCDVRGIEPLEAPE